jgi:hypothetical protein
MRHIKASIAVIFLFLLLPTVNLQAKEWRGIVPLKSTRADVERLLGLPGAHGRYQFKDERVYVNYAEGSCNRVGDCLCLVSKDTVLSIYVELEVETRFSTLKLDKTKYKKLVIVPDASQATYSNDEEGIIYTVDEENDDVIAIQYLPSAKDCEDVMKRRAK